MEAARTSETMVNFYPTTQRYNPEDSHLHLITVQNAYCGFQSTAVFIPQK
jgi:hypothetical protein